MKFKYDMPESFNFFYNYYYPQWLKHGFSWDLFPELTIGININDSKGQINSEREHYTLGANYIFIRMPKNRQELENMGFDFEQYINTFPSSLFHEIGHHIHFTYGTMRDSIFWEKANKLSNGKIRRDFKQNSINGYYEWTKSYEDFANYFEDIIEDRVKNDSFLSWIRELIGIKAVKLTKRDYKIINNKSYVPVRYVAEKLGKEVNWINDTREIWILDSHKK